MELRPGFKQTEIGLVPDDWDVKRIGDIAIPVRGSSPRPAGDPRYFNGNFIPWLTVAALTSIPESKLVVRDTEAYLTEDGCKYSRILHPETLIIANSGATLGVAKILGVKCCANDGIAALFGLAPDISNRYLAHYLNTKTSYLREAVATGNGQPNLNTTLIRNLSLPLPPTKAEQDAIAEALSDVDELIESFEQLIGKKRQIKQGATWELLRPRSNWVGQRLDAVAQIRSGGTPSTANAEYWDGDIFWCTPTDITALNGYKYISATQRSITNQGLRDSSAELIPVNSIVMTTRATIGECAINRVPVATNQGFKNFLPFDHINVEFLYYLLQTKKQNLMGLCSGSTFLEISKSQLAAFEVRIPLDKTEQSSIAIILGEMDAEIVGLENKLSKARLIKEGMLQELLTGRIRLVQPKSNVVPFRAKKETATAAKGHNSAINEAVIISVLAKNFGSDQYPLGRKRYTKLSYLLHRHAEGTVEGYLEKAAGPYNPSTKYKGAEKVALSNRYVRSHARDNFSGFVAAEKIADAEVYFSKWYGDNAIKWLEQFRFKKNDDLELLATVDLAMVRLGEVDKRVDLDSVKEYINDTPEWTAKLNRSIFSDENIDMAMKWSRELFESP